jgi:hypothetical protein
MRRRHHAATLCLLLLLQQPLLLLVCHIIIHRHQQRANQRFGRQSRPLMPQDPTDGELPVSVRETQDRIEIVDGPHHGKVVLQFLHNNVVFPTT